MTDFASKYEKEEHGWILFPISDVTRRKALFPQEVFDHPAKANMWMVDSIIERISKPGDTILDPFGGTGTIMIAALQGRNVTTIEIEEPYQKLLQRIHSEWLDTPDLAENLGNITQLQGDCRLVLPVPCDHVIFSPPYSIALGKTTGMTKRAGEAADEHFKKWGQYSNSANNLGQLNPFLFAKAMDKVYSKLAQSVPAGGKMAVITKDIMRGGQREFLSTACIATCTRVGFELMEWHKWKTGGSMQAKVMRSKGAEVVWDEDILIFQKE